jgi:hypothetical protein
MIKIPLIIIFFFGNVFLAEQRWKDFLQKTQNKNNQNNKKNQNNKENINNSLVQICKYKESQDIFSIKTITENEYKEMKKNGEVKGSSEVSFSQQIINSNQKINEILPEQQFILKEKLKYNEEKSGEGILSENIYADDNYINKVKKTNQNNNLFFKVFSLCFNYDN